MLVYKNTTDFCVLIIHPATLLNLVIITSISFFFVDSMGFSMYIVMSLANRDTLFLSLQCCYLNFFFLSHCSG